MEETKKIRRTRKVREAEQTASDKMAKLILENYDISSITDIEDALKLIFYSKQKYP